LCKGRFSQIWLPEKYESRIFSTFFYIFEYLFEPCIEIWNFFLNFDWILATENLKRHLNLAFLNFNFTIWLYIASKRKGWSQPNLQNFKAEVQEVCVHVVM
jgi:hypothetical protein